MKLHRFLVLLALLALSRPAAAQGLAAWEGPIAEASARFGIPVTWIRRVMHAESAGHTRRYGRPIRSRVGAMGLMQLMPATWRAMRLEHGLGPDPDDPRDNILAGTAYLRAMYDRFGYPGLFGAYNAGPARYADHLQRGRGLPAETIAYVAKVAGGGGSSLPGVPPMAQPDARHRQIMVPRGGDPLGDEAVETREPPGPGVFFKLEKATPR